MNTSEKPKFRHFRELEVWQLARKLAGDVYRTTMSFPNAEQFGLTAQIRRAVVSISSNIAEGHGRRLEGAFIQFLRISIGSTNEVESLAVVSCDLGFLTEEQMDEISTACHKLTVKLSNFISALNKNYVKEVEAEYSVEE